MDKLLNPRNDIAFKRLFGTEQNSDIVISLLNEVFKKQIKNKIVKVKSTDHKTELYIIKEDLLKKFELLEEMNS